MSDLYTSQVHLKRLLAGQATPAFTPITVDAKQYIKPEFVPGMGALNEDDDGRLQCPVCGMWFLKLGQHLSVQHRAIGGVSAVRRALSIPGRVSFLSRKAKPLARAGGGRPFRAGHPSDRNIANAAAVGAMKDRGGTTLSAKNWADTCPAQLQAKIATLAQKLGRSPTSRDFAAEYGAGAFKAVRRVFVTWNNAKAIIGLAAVHRHGSGGWRGGGGVIPQRLVAESLRCWYETHGDLPSYDDVHASSRIPAIPSMPTLRRAFPAKSWRATMQSVALHLGIKSDRYGSPTRRTA